MVLLWYGLEMAVITHFQWQIELCSIDRMTFCLLDSQEIKRHAPLSSVRHPDPEELIQAACFPLLNYKLSNTNDILTWSPGYSVSHPSYLTNGVVGRTNKGSRAGWGLLRAPAEVATTRHARAPPTDQQGSSEKDVAEGEPQESPPKRPFFCTPDPDHENPNATAAGGGPSRGSLEPPSSNLL